MEDLIFKTQPGEMVSVKQLLFNRLEIIMRNAHKGMRRKSKYKGVPLWSFVSDLTGHGSTYSMKICKALGWDADQNTSKPLIKLQKE